MIVGAEFFNNGSDETSQFWGLVLIVIVKFYEFVFSFYLTPPNVKSQTHTMRWALETFRWTVYLGFPIASLALITLPSRRHLKECAERVAHFDMTGVSHSDAPSSLFRNFREHFSVAC